MSEDKKRQKVWINPCLYCSCDCEEDHEMGCEDDESENKYELVYEIPGVKKENIKLKVIKNGLRLIAIRDERVEYVNEVSFLLDCDPRKALAEYKDGILKVTIPIVGDDPFTEIKSLEIK